MSEWDLRLDYTVYRCHQNGERNAAVMMMCAKAVDVETAGRRFVAVHDGRFGNEKEEEEGG